MFLGDLAPADQRELGLEELCHLCTAVEHLRVATLQLDSETHIARSLEGVVDSLSLLVRRHHIIRDAEPPQEAEGHEVLEGDEEPQGAEGHEGSEVERAAGHEGDAESPQEVEGHEGDRAAGPSHGFHFQFSSLNPIAYMKLF